MDNTDIKIINILQANCKTSIREIGQQVGLTAPAVAERINRLKDAGVIEGFHAKINDALMGNHICAFVLINVPPKSYESFCQFCEKSPAVIEPVSYTHLDVYKRQAYTFPPNLGTIWHQS